MAGSKLCDRLETRGSGTPVLLLPAFSTVSTRGEMQGIAEQLAPHFQVVTMDWLGFGQSDRPWKPNETRKNELVFIGRNLDEAQLKEGFRACLT